MLGYKYIIFEKKKNICALDKIVFKHGVMVLMITVFPGD